MRRCIESESLFDLQDSLRASRRDRPRRLARADSARGRRDEHARYDYVAAAFAFGAILTYDRFGFDRHGKNGTEEADQPLIAGPGWLERRSSSATRRFGATMR